MDHTMDLHNANTCSPLSTLYIVYDRHFLPKDYCQNTGNKKSSFTLNGPGKETLNRDNKIVSLPKEVPKLQPCGLFARDVQQNLNVRYFHMFETSNNIDDIFAIFLCCVGNISMTERLDSILITCYLTCEFIIRKYEKYFLRQEQLFLSNPQDYLSKQNGIRSMLEIPWNIIQYIEMMLDDYSGGVSGENFVYGKLYLAFAVIFMMETRTHRSIPELYLDKAANCLSHCEVSADHLRLVLFRTNQETLNQFLESIILFQHSGLNAYRDSFPSLPKDEDINTFWGIQELPAIPAIRHYQHFGLISSLHNSIISNDNLIS